jgi:hypothetical protein
MKPNSKTVGNTHARAHDNLVHAQTEHILAHAHTQTPHAIQTGTVISCMGSKRHKRVPTRKRAQKRNLDISS